MLNEKDDREIEQAIEMMVTALKEHNRKRKPVLMHSLRVVLYLYNIDCDRNTVIAGMLHDTIEASDVTGAQIETRFGAEVRRAVEATSNDESIKDKTEQYRDTFRRCMEAGKNALMVKGADLLDNTIHSYAGETDPEKRKHSLEKVKYFLDFTEQALADSRVREDLRKAYEDCGIDDRR